MDIDGDGKTNDDAYNDTTKMFKRVGELGKSLGLEWGGSWKSPVDKPHFQLPYWGSTAKKLKEQYGTPDKFFATWDKKPATSTKVTNKVTASKNNTDAARSKDTKYCKAYTTTAGLRLRRISSLSFLMVIRLHATDTTPRLVVRSGCMYSMVSTQALYQRSI